MAAKRIAVVWRSAPASGRVEVSGGVLGAVRVAGGSAGRGGRFSFSRRGPGRLTCTIRRADLGHGPRPTLVWVRAGLRSFTFFLRDVRKDAPILLRAYGVAVTEASDGRSYEQIDAGVARRGLRTRLQEVASQPEESYASAASQTQSMIAPTWLGLGRDMRLFEVSHRQVGGYGLELNPRYCGRGFKIPQTKDQNVSYGLVMGRGHGCQTLLRRRLEEGCLPILNLALTDEDVTYRAVLFAAPERGWPAGGKVRGTDWRVADGYGAGSMLSDEQRKRFDRLAPGELDPGEETVLCARIEACNAAAAGRYAWLMYPRPNFRSSTGRLDPAMGFCRHLDSDRVYAVVRLNGRPMPQGEVAVLLGPGERAVLEFFLLHRPVAPARATALARKSFDTLHAGCRKFWRDKLASGGRIHLPEPILDEMVRAGLLHLDLVAYGREPRGTLVPTIGVYTAIGSESSPILQFFDSMGWHRVAERALGFFLEKQRADGFIQNYGGYMLETGPALWTMGEHYRYTQDRAWVRRIRGNLVRACEYMLAWRRRNMRPELRGRGYGLQEGKVADPNDLFHSFMLNGYAFLGMSRVAEMLRKVDPPQSRRWAREAQAFRKDIRRAYFESLARSPVVPMGDGSWVPTVGPWAEARGPVSLYAEGGEWFTHGTFTARDSIIGPLYLILSEVLDPREPAAEMLLNWHAELMTLRNVAFSQPYYCRHDFAHLRRGEVRAFLKTYYNALTGLADRQTYTFWEHFFQASPHKTHEEGWFLMQTRWMLWMEEGEALRLLAAVPRAWLEHGKEIELENVATYFGPLSLRVRSRVNEGILEASVRCGEKGRRPKTLLLRLPHPGGRRAASVEGGRYDAAAETVRISPFTGRATVRLTF